MTRYRRLASVAVFLAILLLAALAPTAGATGPELVVTPDPVVVHIGSAVRVPFGTAVQVEVQAIGFAPAGNYFISIAGAYTFRPTCRAVTAVTVCSVPVPYIPKGTYTMLTRYQSPSGGLVVSAQTTVIVTT